MKKIIVAGLLVLLFGCLVYAQRVSGYYRSNGTYVESYERSSSNDTVRDNWTYKGNTNPYTGEEGSNYYKRSKSSEYYDSSLEPIDNE